MQVRRSLFKLTLSISNYCQAILRFPEQAGKYGQITCAVELSINQCPLSVQDCFPALCLRCVVKTGFYVQHNLFNPDYPEMMLRAVEIFLFHNPQPPENMMEWVGGRPPPFPLRTLELFASTLELGQKRCHSSNEVYFSPAYILFYGSYQ